MAGWLGGCVGRRNWSSDQDSFAFLLQVKNNNEKKKKQSLLSTYHVPNTVQNIWHVLTNLMQYVAFTNEQRKTVLTRLVLSTSDGGMRA